MFRLSLGLLALSLSFPVVRGATITDDSPNRVIISVRDQKLMLVQNDKRVALYPVSTSKFGLGDSLGRMTTPLGFLQVVCKIGDNAPAGAVFHNRRWTGEVLKPNAPGRDPIVTRIIWLRGLEAENAHAFGRCIYIHGTAEERNIGRPASYGCIRMRSKDVTALYNLVAPGTVVQIVPDRLPSPKTAIAASPTPPIPPLPSEKLIFARDAEKTKPRLIASRGRRA
jgi:lipoprotein-anchoring transpeptidase ErfK/SrfK